MNSKSCESFSVILDLANGSRQLINIPAHYTNKQWGVYIDYANLILGFRGAGPNTSWNTCCVPLPYIPILIDSPTDTFDVFGKGINLIGQMVPKSIDGGGSGTFEVIYENQQVDIKNIIPIMTATITITFLDITNNMPLDITNNTPGIQLLNINSSNHAASYTAYLACGLIGLKFIELN